MYACKRVSPESISQTRKKEEEEEEENPMLCKKIKVIRLSHRSSIIIIMLV